MMMQRDAMIFYRGYQIARSALDSSAIQEGLLTQPKPPHMDLKSIKCGIPKAMSPCFGRRKAVTASMVAHRGGRSNAGSSKNLNVAMLEENPTEADSCPENAERLSKIGHKSKGKIIAQHRRENEGKIEHPVSKKPTPAPRHRTSFSVEAMVHNPDDANL